MSVFVKTVNANYNTRKDLNNLINYVLTDKRTGRLCYCIGGFGAGTVNTFKEMVMVQDYYGKTEGRLAKHIIVSFEDSQDISADIAYRIALKTALYYSARFQIIFSVHEDTEHTHIHFVLNTVSFVDGKKFSESSKEFNEFKGYVDSVVNEYKGILNHY